MEDLDEERVQTRGLPGVYAHLRSIRSSHGRGVASLYAAHAAQGKDGREARGLHRLLTFDLNDEEDEEE